MPAFAKLGGGPAGIHFVRTAAILYLAALLVAACATSEAGRPATAPAPATLTSPDHFTPTRLPTKTPTVTPIREIVVSPPVEIGQPMPTLPAPEKAALESAHFAYYLVDDYRPLDMVDLAGAAEQMFQEIGSAMSAGLGAELPGTINVIVLAPQGVVCPARGLTMLAADIPAIYIFANEETRQEQVRGVLAHQLAHVLHAASFNGQLAGDSNLSEGVATWFSRRYWLAWHHQVSLEEMVRGYLQAGDYIPLAEANVLGAYPRTQGSSGCLVQRDLLYTQWASFVGYLAEHYGWPTLAGLLASSVAAGGEDLVQSEMPIDYQSHYGKDLAALELEWLAWLRLGP